MTGAAPCEWSTGTYDKPSHCSKPAKARISAPWHHNGLPLLVCGIHANAGARRGWKVTDGI